MKRIYIAGKLNADAVNYIKNMHIMIKYADEIRRLGFAPYVPCLDILMGLVFGDYEYLDYYNINHSWLLAADAVFVLFNRSTSPGAKGEIKTAKEHGIPVFDNIRALVNYFDGRDK